MRDEYIDWTLVRKRIDGNLTTEERERLERWMRGDKRRKRFVEQAACYYERDIPVVDDSRIEQAWRWFVRHREMRKRRRILRIVGGVAASVFLLLGGWLLWLPERGNVIEMTPRQEIAIGAPRARLIISDGTEVDLSLGSPKRTIVDKEVSVALDSASLSYERNVDVSDTVRHIVEVPRGGEFHLTLSDGTQVWLNAESRLTYPIAFGGEERRVKLEGEGYFEVEPGKGRFVVETNGMAVRVLGTAFNVNAYKNEMIAYTTLVRGRVEIVTDDNNVAKTLAPGEQATWNRRDGNVDVRQVNTYLYTQWIKGQFVFRDAPLRDIMKTLARWYEMEYEFACPAVEEERFYGIIDRFEHVERLLEQFEKTGKVHFEYEGNKVIVKK